MLKYKQPFNSINSIHYSHFAVEKFLPKNPIYSVLEVGCGLGSFTFRYLSANDIKDYIAVDISQLVIHFLNTHYAKYYPNLKFLSCDFCDKVIFDNKFDFIYSADVLEHVYSTKSFVKNVFHCLHGEKGFAIINFPNLNRHGINHFDYSDKLFKLFAAFSEVQIYKIKIDTHQTKKIFYYFRNIFDVITNNKYKRIRDNPKKPKEEDKGDSCFEDTSSFKFAKENVGVKNDIACLFTEIILLKKPSIKTEIILSGENIENLSRIIVVAKK